MTGDRDRAGRAGQTVGSPPAPASGLGDGAGGPFDLGAVMGQVARSLQEEHGDVEGTLQAITRAAVGSVPGADECGISLVTGGRRVELRAPTGDLPREAEQLQERLGEGPCLDSIAQHATVRIDDSAQERRWPRFAAGAAEAGMGSLLSFPLSVTGDTLGALNLYSYEPHSFTDESESIGSVFASHASIALAGAQQEQRLHTAISSRDLIGQAKGILMERFRLTAAQAFAVLVRTSSLTNRKLLDVADELCSTGALPEPDPGTTAQPELTPAQGSGTTPGRAGRGATGRG